MRKSVGQTPTAGQQTQQKTVSHVFRHRSGTGKSYCRTRFDVGSERVKREYNHTYINKKKIEPKEYERTGEGYPIHLLKNYSNITCKSSILHRTRK
jgi:hypothetical protein